MPDQTLSKTKLLCESQLWPTKHEAERIHFCTALATIDTSQEHTTRPATSNKTDDCHQSLSVGTRACKSVESYWLWSSEGSLPTWSSLIIQYGHCKKWMNVQGTINCLIPCKEKKPHRWSMRDECGTLSEACSCEHSAIWRANKERSCKRLFQGDWKTGDFNVQELYSLKFFFGLGAQSKGRTERQFWEYCLAAIVPSRRKLLKQLSSRDCEDLVLPHAHKDSVTFFWVFFSERNTTYWSKRCMGSAAGSLPASHLFFCCEHLNCHFNPRVEGLDGSQISEVAHLAYSAQSTTLMFKSHTEQCTTCTTLWLIPQLTLLIPRVHWDTTVSASWSHFRSLV